MKVQNSSVQIDDKSVGVSKQPNLLAMHNERSFDHGMLPRAKFWTRAVAMVIDLILLEISSQLVVASIGVPSTIANGSPSRAIVDFGIILVVFCAPLYASGQTLGKKIMKIKVIPLQGEEHLTIWQIFGREFLGKFVSMVVFGLGYFWAIWDKEKQTWHDKIVMTCVVSLNSEN